MKLVKKSPTDLTEVQCDISCRESPCLDSSWHYHAQYELIYISKSSGIRFVGDSVAHFSAGDLVLVGPNLPHLWRNDQTYYQGNKNHKVKTVVLKFSRDFIGQATFDNPKFKLINALLEKSNFGISFGQQTSKKLHKDLLSIVELSPAEQLIKLLYLLCQLSMTDEYTVLSSTDMRQYTSGKLDRFDAVLKHISDHYGSDISLKDVAGIACMTTNSFCRFFKKKTNKSFTRFLNEVRVKNATRLLVQQNLSVSEVCYMVGYKSLTNFYRQFRQITGDTPMGYRQAI